MTNRKLLVLAVVAAVLVVFTVILYSDFGGSRVEFNAGVNLIQGMDPGKIHSIVIKSGDDTVTLKRRDEGFTVVEKDDYPASISKINELVTTCLDIRCAEKITESPENHAELGVAEDSSDAITVSFLGEDDKRIVGIVKGKSSSRGAGAYVRLLGENAVYTSEKYLYINTSPTDYVERELVSVKTDDIERVSVKTGKDSYTIVRDKDGKIVLQTVPRKKRVKGTEHESVFEALSSVSMDDVEPLTKFKGEWDTTYECRMKSGLTYVVQLAEKDDKYYAKFSARQPSDDEVERAQRITKTESKEKLKQKAAVLDALKTAKDFTSRHAGWVYELSSWTAEKMRKPLDELVEDIPEEKKEAKAPEEITASHILISYKGAERSEAKRTKEEARQLAERVLKEAKAKGADFAALAKKYSDGPTKDKGGDLGAFKKGAMDPAFEKAAFKLKVGEISGVVETPFGFHIIKRTK